MKCVKVIVAAINLDRFERPANQMKYPHHPQWKIDLKEQLKIWEVQRRAMMIDGGMDFDTLVVCNGWGAFLQWADYDGMKTANGVLKVVWRKNSGGSFGGYNWAFRNTDYDGFIFTEDDIIVAGENYYKRLVETMHSENRVGYVCLIGASRKEDTRHCHGGVGFTTRKRLKLNVDKRGDLPFPHALGWNQREAIRKGEIPFTNGIREQGYKLICIPEITRQWDFINFCKPYWCLDKADYAYLGYTRKELYEV
jgi:hypothetical protein